MATKQLWTAVVKFTNPWGEDLEEVDVVAANLKTARRLVEGVLVNDYEGRGRIVKLELHPGPVIRNCW